MAITFTVVMAEAVLAARRLGVFVLLRFSPPHRLEKTSHSLGSPAMVLI